MHRLTTRVSYILHKAYHSASVACLSAGDRLVVSPQSDQGLRPLYDTHTGRNMGYRTDNREKVHVTTVAPGVLAVKDSGLEEEEAMDDVSTHGSSEAVTAIDIDPQYLVRPSDMPPDSVDLRFQDEDFFYWNMINAGDFEPALKVEMKNQLLMDRKMLQLQSTVEELEFEDESDEEDLPASFREKHAPFLGQEREVEDEGAEDEEDEEDRATEIVPYISADMESDFIRASYSDYDKNAVDEDGRPIRTITEDMSASDMKVKEEYILGADADIMKEFSPMVQRTFSVSSAGRQQLRKYRIAMALKKFQKFEGDTGSPACTLAAMTENLSAMQQHMSKNHKDMATQRRMELLIVKRRRYMTWFRKSDFNAYRDVVSYLGLRDIGFPEVGQSRPYSYRPRNKQYDPIKGKTPAYRSTHPTDSEKGGKKKRKKKTKKMWRRNKN